jgi:hypothetical protein
MASKKPHEMSNEELLKREKLLKVAFYTLGITNLLLLALGGWLIAKKGAAFTALVIIPGGMAQILFLIMNSRKAMKKEMVERGLA